MFTEKHFSAAEVLIAVLLAAGLLWLFTGALDWALEVAPLVVRR